MKTNRAVLYLLIFLLLSVTTAWFYFILPLSALNNILGNVSAWVDTTLISRYPDNLLISAKNGVISLNHPTPYCLVVDDKTRSGIVFTGDQDPRVLTFSDGTYSSLCKPLALIGENYFIYPDENNTYKVQAIDGNINFDLDKNQIIKFTNQYLPLLLQGGRRAYYFIPFLAIPFLLIVFLCQNLWYSLVAKTIIKIFKLNSGDKKSEIYGTCLFIYTTILFVDWVIIGLILNHTFNQNINLSIPFFNTAVISIGTALMLKSDIQSQQGNDRSPLPPAV